MKILSNSYTLTCNICGKIIENPSNDIAKMIEEIIEGIAHQCVKNKEYKETKKEVNKITGEDCYDGIIDDHILKKMNEDGWIRFDDEIPKIDKEIEVKFFCGQRFITKLLKGKTYFYLSEKDCFFPDERATEWRYIKQKRPDFGKLREGDFSERFGRYCSRA